jgi:aryl-alcohol dehydrogenase-like predicted oxidoreductase
VINYVSRVAVSPGPFWRGHIAIARCRCGLRLSPRLSRRKPSSTGLYEHPDRDRRRSPKAIREIGEGRPQVVDRVAEVAAARGVPRAQVALAWLLAKPVITAPIVGATKLHHLDDALASVNVKLSADEITSLEEPYVPHAVVGFV